MARTNPSAKAAASAAPVAEPEAPAESSVLPEDESDAPTPLAVKEQAPLPSAPGSQARYRTIAQCSNLLEEGKIIPPGVVLALDDSVAVHYLKQNAIERVF